VDLRTAEATFVPSLLRHERHLLAALVVAGAAAWAVALVLLLDSGLIDLQVYRTGGQAWSEGIPLYGRAFPAPLPGPALPFTYPPLAAVLFAGLAALPWGVAVAFVTGTGIAGLVLASRVVADRLTEDRLTEDRARPLLTGVSAVPGVPRPGVVGDVRRRAAVLTAAAVAIAPLLEPVRESVSFGQINLLLLGVITADCLLPRTPWPRGLLIGLAAAIKLTPAAFVLFFIARRQWRPVLVAAATFVVVGVAGWLLAPSDTREYWLGALLDPSRIGGLEFASNQSLRGMLHRLGLPPGLESLGWLGLSSAIGVLALIGVAALRRRGDEPGALLVTAAAALLVSPVSWSHHWVWAAPGLLWLGALAWRRRSAPLAGLAAFVAAVFVAAPHWHLPSREGRELSWAWWQHLVGNTYFWCALAAVMVAAAAATSVPSLRGQPR
jgi:alpha-1,2-mannosyltransferase